MADSLRVVVTAGGNGIGRTVAQRLRERGDQVFICDVNDETVAQAVEAEGLAGGCAADVTDESQVDQLFAQALDRLGGIDILVNTAGIGGPTGPLEDLSLDAWKACISVTLDGTFLCSRKAIPLMKAQKSGSIVNFSSTAGLYGYPNRTPYAAAKWGVIGLTKSMAMELGSSNVRVNVICPGAVSGDRMDRVIAADARATGRSEEEIRASYTAGTSLKSFVSADDLAEMILFITSPAGKMISGQALTVDGHTESIN
ncbi:SDR family oxidoreductase [Coralliovum pocilloporae]|uniref:SDR family oxidoreductase n=1 Tax=Coralliovum pocilloporae TaxID=3066369 RepID=UPI0033072E89